MMVEEDLSDDDAGNVDEFVVDAGVSDEGTFWWV